VAASGPLASLARCLTFLCLALLLTGTAVHAEEPVERTKTIESFEFWRPISVSPGHEKHLSHAYVSEGAAHGKRALKLSARFDTSRRERYRVNLPRKLSPGTLKVALAVSGKGAKHLLVPVLSYMERNRRKEERPLEAAVEEGADSQRIEFEVPGIADKARSGYRFEAIEIAELVDPKIHSQASECEVLVDAIETVSLVPPDQPWELALFSGHPRDAFLAEPEDGVKLFAEVDLLKPPIPREVRLLWEIRDREDKVVTSGDDEIKSFAGGYAVQELKFRTGGTTGPYVAAARCYEGPRPSPTREEVFRVGEPGMDFKFVVPEISKRVELSSGFARDDSEQKLVLRAAFKNVGMKHHFSLLIPEKAQPVRERLRFISLDIELSEVGSNVARATAVILDATGAELSLPKVVLTRPLKGSWLTGAWHVPDWESGLVRFPVRIKEIKFWKHGWPDDWQGSIAVDRLKLTYSGMKRLRFSVANARTRTSDFSHFERLEGETFSYGAAEGDGHGDQRALSIRIDNTKSYAGRRVLKLDRPLPGSPISFSFWAKCTGAKVGLLPQVYHRGHWMAARSHLVLKAQTLSPDDGWKLLRWQIPCSGTGMGAATEWTHVVVYPLKLVNITFTVPAKQVEVLIDDLSVLTQLPVEESLSATARAIVSRQGDAWQSQVQASVDNWSLRQTEADLRYGLVDAKDEELLAREARIRLAPGESRALDLTGVDFARTEGPYLFSSEIALAGKEEATAIRSKTPLIVPNAEVVLLSFDKFAYLKGGVQKAEAARSGRYGVELLYGGRGYTQLTGIRTVAPGYPLKVSVWIKGNTDGMTFNITGHDRGPNVDVHHPKNTAFSTTQQLIDWDDWKRITLDLPMGPFPPATGARSDVIDYPLLFTGMGFWGPRKPVGSLYIDEITVLTQLPPSELLSVGLDLALPSRVVAVGEELHAFVENRSILNAFSGTLRFQLFAGSLLGSEGSGRARVVSRDLPISAKPGERARVSLGERMDKAGPFTARLEVLSGKETLASREQEYLVMGLSPDQVKTFAADITEFHKQYVLGSVRSDTMLLDWLDIEYHAGDMNFDKYDAELTKVLPLCPFLVGRLGYCTYWNSPRGIFYPEWGNWEGDSYQFPKDLKAWHRYAHETVRQYKGKIKHWEVWTEPAKSAEDINMDLDRYLRLLQIANLAIRHADPQAKIIAGSLTPMGMTGYLGKFLEKGGGKWVDIIGLHPASGSLDPENSFLAERVREVVAKVRNHDPKLQVWVTTLGWQTTSRETGGGVPESAQAEYLARGKVLCLAGGAARVMDRRHGLDHVRGGTALTYKEFPLRFLPGFHTVTTPNWFFKPAFLSQKVSNEVLDGARYVAEALLADRSAHYSRCYLFESGKGNEILAAMWRRRGKCSVDLRGIADPRRVLDMYGNSVDAKTGRLELSPGPCYAFFEKSALDRLMTRLPVAAIDYESPPHSAWKRRLLDYIDRTPETLRSHGHAVKGQLSEASAEGEYRPGIVLQARTLNGTGSESFAVNLASIGSDDLVILRRVDLRASSGAASVRVNGEEVARYDLSGLERFTKRSRKRFFDLPILVRKEKINAKGRVKMEFAALSGTQSSLRTHFYAKARGPVYLSDIDYLAAQQSWSFLREDENFVGRPLGIQEQAFEKGLCTHAKAQVIYYLGGQFSKFHVHPGLERSATGGSAVFLVLVDGKAAYESEAVTGFSKTQPIEIDVSGAQLLELRVGSAGDGIDGDWACWADARVE